MPFPLEDDFPGKKKQQGKKEEKPGKSGIPGGTRGSSSIADEAGVTRILNFPFQVFPGSDPAWNSWSPFPVLVTRGSQKKLSQYSWKIPPALPHLSIFPLKFPFHGYSQIFFAGLEKGSKADGRKESWKILDKSWINPGKFPPNGKTGAERIPRRNSHSLLWDVGSGIQYPGNIPGPCGMLSAQSFSRDSFSIMWRHPIIPTSPFPRN